MQHSFVQARRLSHLLKNKIMLRGFMCQTQYLSVRHATVWDSSWILTPWGSFDVHLMHDTRAFFTFHLHRNKAAQQGSDPALRLSSETATEPPWQAFRVCSMLWLQSNEKSSSSQAMQEMQTGTMAWTTTTTTTKKLQQLQSATQTFQCS